jgi:hypothetical protein
MILFSIILRDGSVSVLFFLKSNLRELFTRLYLSESFRCDFPIERLQKKNAFKSQQIYFLFSPLSFVKDISKPGPSGDVFLVFCRILSSGFEKFCFHYVEQVKARASTVVYIKSV